MWMLAGRDAPESPRNLQEWIDSIALSICLRSLALNRHRQRLKGHYHQMKSDLLLGEISDKLDECRRDCHNRDNDETLPLMT